MCLGRANLNTFGRSGARSHARTIHGFMQTRRQNNTFTSGGLGRAINTCFVREGISVCSLEGLNTMDGVPPLKSASN